jgi:hypothetical protein
LCHIENPSLHAIIIEEDHRPIAVIKPSTPAGRSISAVIAELKARGSTAVIDDEFARDVEAGIETKIARI